MRLFLDAGPGTEVVARVDAEGASLSLAHASLLARALDALERLEAAPHLEAAGRVSAHGTGARALADCPGEGGPDGQLAHRPQGGRR
ncbi:MAG: hypothetical protein M0Z42_17075 [Actinomycetota bacterium]|nr:hypothetical protein [Actinomycetota bacterium]